MEVQMNAPLDQVNIIEVISSFESACSSIKHEHCKCCRRIGLGLMLDGNSICSSCLKYSNNEHFKNQHWLPIWYMNGEAIYGVPMELSRLSLAEQMLIQLATPFIPLRHIKNGVFGLCGHVCSFDQDVEGFVNTLPRKKTDVTMLQVLRDVRDEIGHESTRPQSYRVRKSFVGEALRWLKTYNVEYKDINIDMSALDWLVHDEGSMESLDIICKENIVTDEDTCFDINSDMGPSPRMTRGVMETGSAIKSFGYVCDGPGDILSPDDTLVHNEILEVVDTSARKKEISVKWPSMGPVAISEYGTARIFARAFPWLFPGGLGDVKDFPEDISKWGRNLLQYEDGRFSKDKFFCFYALNYITRNRNASSGNWFIKEFNKGGPENLEELKECIKNGDLEFVNRLTYFNKRVKGSTSFWFQKRAEVYSWINHHVEAGNGPPTFFITLSCAEYYWPDIIRLLRERMQMAGDDFEQCYSGSSHLSRILNDYSIVVQEYFQHRVELWLESVGTRVFGIKHHWGKFEFTPGRGQIHIHLLAIPFDHNIYRLCHEDLKQQDGKKRRNERLAKWASEFFGLTANVDEGFEDRIVGNDDSPCSIRFTDIGTLPEAIHQDQQKLLKFCQYHECNGFCLRQKNKKK
jgi:Helitron helicase-like domain at N-terminus